MARTPLGDVIAERSYEWRDARGARAVTVRLGRPVPDPAPGGDWACPVAFRGAPRGLLPRGVQPVYGIDALQALVLAVGYAQRELAGLSRAGRGDLTWLDAPDLGLPDIVGLIGSARMFRAPPKRRLAGRPEPAS